MDSKLLRSKKRLPKVFGEDDKRRRGRRRSTSAPSLPSSTSMAKKGTSVREMLRALADQPYGGHEIVSYNECYLYGSDLDVLSGHYCIRSHIIDFYFSLLADSCSCTESEKVLLVPPSITSKMLAKHSDFETLYNFVNQHDLRQKELVIFSVSDEDDVAMAGEWLHWSLLVYDHKKNIFVHHDSSEGVNRIHAENIYENVRLFLDCPEFIEGDTPQQTHFYDSGMYMMAIARTICEWYDLGLKKEDHLWFSFLKERVNDAMVAEMRNELLSSIQFLCEDS